MNPAEIQQKITPVLAKHGVLKASLFGSVARGEDTTDSDIDLLVRLGKPTGLFEFTALNRELEETLGKNVDLVTEQSINKFVRPYVLPDLKTIYERPCRN